LLRTSKYEEKKIVLQYRVMILQIETRFYVPENIELLLKKSRYVCKNQDMISKSWHSCKNCNIIL